VERRFRAQHQGYDDEHDPATRSPMPTAQRETNTENAPARRDAHQVPAVI